MNALAVETLDSPAQSHAALAPAAATRTHYPGLDGLRGLAILAVFASHFSGGHTSGNRVAHALAALLDAGWIGVDLFFVLSGFLITGVLLNTAGDRNRARNFYARRALRIFPVFYGVLASCLLLTPFLHLSWRPQHLLYFLFLSNMLPLLGRHGSSPGFGVDLLHLWSLAVEEQFYLLWPLVVWTVCDRERLLRLCGCGMAAALLLRLVLVGSGVDTGIVYQLTATRADSLLAGGALALLLRRSQSPVPAFKAAGAISGAAVLAMFVVSGNGRHEGVPVATWGYSALAVFFCCLVYGAQLREGRIRRLAGWSVFRFFGRYSYGLYIYHGVLLMFLLRWLQPLQAATHSAMMGGLLFVLVSLLVCLSLAMISYHLVEAPILRWKRYFQ